MGRRKLHLTTEAKQEANRAKSRRSYEKHRAATNERRRNQYQPKESTIKDTVAVPSTTPNVVPGIGYSVQRIQQIQKNIKTFTAHRSAHTFINMIRIEYMSAPNNEGIQDAVAKMVHYRTMVSRHQDTLLQLVGPMSAEWADADVVYRDVNSLVQGLEDLEAHTMLGHDEVEAQYKARTLMYQNW